MLILALDTTSRAGSLALVRDGELVHERLGDAARTHGERLPLDFNRLCAAAGIKLRDVDLLAVAAGPGSFTGLRVGIASMQGLAIALDRLVVPVPTLEAVAAAAPRSDGTLAAWIDGQRGEVFGQLFDVPATRRNGELGPLVTAIGEAAAATPENLLDAWRSARPLRELAFHGDGAVRYADRIRAAAGPDARIGTAAALAAAVGRIAAAEPHRAVRPHAIVPIYVRRPDAELARARRGGSA